MTAVAQSLFVSARPAVLANLAGRFSFFLYKEMGGDMLNRSFQMKGMSMSIEDEISHGEVLCPGCSAKYELKSVPVPNDENQKLTCRRCQATVFTYSGPESYWLDPRPGDLDD